MAPIDALFLGMMVYAVAALAYAAVVEWRDRHARRVP
jgi:hypothetical protein